MKKIALFIVLLVTLLLLTGIYRFNFTNDDIYVENQAGEWVKYDDLKLENHPETSNE